MTTPPPVWSWPVTLNVLTALGEPLVLRPLSRSDEAEFHRVRAQNRSWLARWDATSPVPVATTTFRAMVRQHEADARDGRALPLVITLDGHIVGQVNTSGITRGAFWSGVVGYWVSRHVAGRGIMPTALAAVCDHLMDRCGLHRIEVNIRPENDASLAVVRKLGFREEGLRRRFLHIDGDWRDHLSFALTVEDVVGESLIERCHHAQLESLARHTEEGPAAPR